MLPFARALSAVYVGKEPFRPLASESLGAVMLDASGLLPEEIEGGRIVVVVGESDVGDCVEAALRRIFHGRIHDAEDLSMLLAEGKPLADRIMMVDGAAAMKPGWWMVTVGEHSLGCAMVVDGPHEIHTDVDAWRTRTVSLPDVDSEGVIPDAIRLATGDQFVVKRSHYKGATVADFRSSLGTRTRAKDAVATLSKIVSGRKAKALKAEAKADATGEFVASLLHEPEPLSAPVDRVVRKLSAMTGFGEAGTWGVRLAADIRDYKEGRLPWSDLDRGALLVGPPGSGKTTFARALALECDVELVVTTYNEWQGAGSGDVMAKGLKKHFETWREKGQGGPFLLFVDEIDSMGARGSNGNNETWLQTIINAWLAFLDGALPRPGVIVLAATNHLARVDSALCRPGRLDRVIDLPYPDAAAMAGIVRHHLGRDAVIDEAELAAAARACRGKSPAQIEQICREARSMCRHLYGGRRVCAADVVDFLAVQRMMRGRTPILETSVAVHEASHAVAAIALGHGVLSADVDAGQVQLAKDRPLHDRGGIEADMVIGLAGKAGELVVLGHESTSGGADVEQVTASALTLHARVGLGVAGHVRLSNEMILGDGLYEAVRATTDAAWDRALRLVRHHKANVRRVAMALQRDRYLDAAEVRALMRHPLRELQRPYVDEPDGYPMAIC